MNDNRGTWIAFLAVCFAVVGLAGVFVSYAAPLPYERAVSRLAALERGNDATPAARAAILGEAEREASAIAARLRLLLGVLTVLAGGFGIGIMLIYRRQPIAPGSSIPGRRPEP